MRSSKNKKRHRMCSLQLHLGTQLLGILLFSITRWRICPGCHFVGGAGGLGSGMCSTHGSSTLSFSALKASIFLILWWNSGPPRADIRNWMLQNPSGSGWLFLSLPFKGLHIYIWQFLLWPAIALLRPKVSNPDNYTVTTQQDVQLESSAWSLLHLIFWGIAFLGPGARCPPIGPCPLD